jgi:hypothetical protein
VTNIKAMEMEDAGCRSPLANLAKQPGKQVEQLGNLVRTWKGGATDRTFPFLGKHRSELITSMGLPFHGFSIPTSSANYGLCLSNATTSFHDNYSRLSPSLVSGCRCPKDTSMADPQIPMHP